MEQVICLYPKDKVKITGELVGGGVPFKKPSSKPAGFSNRMSCAKCFSCVMNNHSDTMGMIDM